MDSPRNIPEAAFWLASLFAIGFLWALAIP